MKDQDDFKEGTGEDKEELLDFEFDDLSEGENEEGDFDFSSNLDDDILELTNIAKEEEPTGEETKAEDIEELLDLEGLEKELGEEKPPPQAASDAGPEQESLPGGESSEDIDAELDALVKELESSEADLQAEEDEKTEEPAQAPREEVQAPQFEEIDTQEVMELDSDFISEGPAEEEPEEEISELSPLDEESEISAEEDEEIEFADDFLEEVDTEEAEDLDLGAGLEPEGPETEREEFGPSFEDWGPSLTEQETARAEPSAADVSQQISAGISEDRLQAILQPMVERAVEKAVRETMASTAERVINEAIESLKASVEDSLK